MLFFFLNLHFGQKVIFCSLLFITVIVIFICKRTCQGPVRPFFSSYFESRKTSEKPARSCQFISLRRMFRQKKKKLKFQKHREKRVNFFPSYLYFFF